MYSLGATTRYLLLALVGGVSRVVFVRPTPINWDGVQFALALGHFDLQAHQPHPPGYILYVLLGRSLLPLWTDPAVALSMLSVLFSAVALPLIYWLARNVLEDERAGICAALLWLASPLALYYGSVGLTYMPEAVLSMAVAGLAWRVRSGATHGMALAVALGVVLGLVGGVRQTSIVVLLPLCVWSLWGRSVGYRRRVAFGLSFAVTCALWFVPLLWMSGGLQAYLRENALLAETVSERTSLIGAGLEGVTGNVTYEVLGLVLGLGFALVPLGLWATRVIRFSLTPGLKGFLLWWTLPAALFYAVSHVGQYGYMLVILPPLLLLSAACAVVAAERVGRSWAGFAPAFGGAAFCALLAVGSAAYFTLGSGPTTADAINDNDAHAVALRGLLKSMDPGDIVLVTSVAWEKPFRLVGYMFPAFHVYANGSDPSDKIGWLYSSYGGQSTYQLPRPPAMSRIVLPAGTHHVISLDDETAEMLGGKKELKAVSLGDGSTLYMLDSAGSPITALVIEDKEIKAASGLKQTTDESSQAHRRTTVDDGR